MARSVNLSPSRLRHLFKAETGMTPVQYLRALRMRFARESLETTHLSVKEIIAKAGVSDKSHFMRNFKKTYGVTLAQYRSYPAKKHVKSGSLTNLNGLCVLLIEGEGETRAVVALLLEFCGAHVMQAASASEALALLKQRAPDILVVGTRSSSEYDRALIRRIRESVSGLDGELPAVALIEDASTKARTRAILAGYQMHIPKPVDPTELAAVIGNLARWIRL